MDGKPSAGLLTAVEDGNTNLIPRTCIDNQFTHNKEPHKRVLVGQTADFKDELDSSYSIHPEHQTIDGDAKVYTYPYFSKKHWRMQFCVYETSTARTGGGIKQTQLGKRTVKWAEPDLNPKNFRRAKDPSGSEGHADFLLFVWSNITQTELDSAGPGDKKNAPTGPGDKKSVAKGKGKAPAGSGTGSNVENNNNSGEEDANPRPNKKRRTGTARGRGNSTARKRVIAPGRASSSLVRGSSANKADSDILDDELEPRPKTPKKRASKGSQCWEKFKLGGKAGEMSAVELLSASKQFQKDNPQIAFAPPLELMIKTNAELRLAQEEDADAEAIEMASWKAWKVNPYMDMAKLGVKLPEGYKPTPVPGATEVKADTTKVEVKKEYPDGYVGGMLDPNDSEVVITEKPNADKKPKVEINLETSDAGEKRVSAPGAEPDDKLSKASASSEETDWFSDQHPIPQTLEEADQVSHLCGLYGWTSDSREWYCPMVLRAREIICDHYGVAVGP